MRSLLGFGFYYLFDNELRRIVFEYKINDQYQIIRGWYRRERD